MREHKILYRILLTGAVLLTTFGVRAESVAIYISAPGTMATFLNTATTETFDSATPGTYTTDFNSAIGIYRASGTGSSASNFRIQAADQYGGAGGTQYWVFGKQSGTSGPVTLDLNGSYNYFGFWWSAGDRNNGISLYRDNNFLGRFSTASILTLLSSPTITAIDGTTTANSHDYFGNPNSGSQHGKDINEPFAYVHLIDLDNTFNRLVFDNSNSASTGFETDNHSVYSGTIDLPPTSTFLVTTVLAPEPATFGLAGLALAGLAIVSRRRKA